jgi:hypothetical protein
MEFLKVTATNGTSTYIPDNYVVHVHTAADTLDAGSDYSAPKVIRNRITEVSYAIVTGTTFSWVTAAAIPAYNGANIRYEYGCKTLDGTFSAAMSN